MANILTKLQDNQLGRIFGDKTKNRLSLPLNKPMNNRHIIVLIVVTYQLYSQNINIDEELYLWRNEDGEQAG